MNFDVVVIGSGAAGLTAAFTGARSGLKVAVLEATPLYGGTTAFSGGGIWIPANHHQKKMGIEDSIDQAKVYLSGILGNDFDDAKISAFLETGPEMLRFLEQETGLVYLPSPMLDYYPERPGASVGRTLSPGDYDGRKLGPLFAKLRPPIPEMGLFHSMQVGPFDLWRLQGWNKSLSNAFWSARRVGRYLLDRLVYGRGTTLVNGSGLVAALLKTAQDAGVSLINNARARSLVMAGGRISAVVVERDGQEETISAARGVILASGGFGANEEMRRKYQPQAAEGWSLEPEGSRGDGIAMAVAVGGLINETNVANGIWAPMSAIRRRDGTLARFPSFIFDRYCPGSIIVDARTGTRFINESCSYQNYGQIAGELGVTRAWMISDAEAVAKYGIGMVKPRPFSPKPWVRRGYVAEARTIGELASKIGLDPATLEATVSRFNTHAESGQDPDFHRGESAYDAFMGDPLHKPNPALGPLRKGPFYALELRTGSLSTLAGLKTNARAQVLDASGDPIPSLYAAGLVNNSVMFGHYPGAGSSIGPAMTFGYVAARELAAFVPSGI